jgi:hypothetical protein
MMHQADIGGDRSTKSLDNMPKQQKAHVASHHKWSHPNAVLIFWFDKCPQCHDTEAKN